MNPTHFDDQGHARMVNIGEKSITHRTAVASCFVKISPEAMDAIRSRTTPKGDPLETARIAGIMAAKRTSELIPLCHPLPIQHIDIQIEIKADGLAIRATVSTEAKTGVEMEALVAVSIAGLTIYDMCKAIDRGMVITDVRLESKSGGMSGEYLRHCDS